MHCWGTVLSIRLIGWSDTESNAAPKLLVMTSTYLRRPVASLELTSIWEWYIDDLYGELTVDLKCVHVELYLCRCTIRSYRCKSPIS